MIDEYEHIYPLPPVNIIMPRSQFIASKVGLSFPFIRDFHIKVQIVVRFARSTRVVSMRINLFISFHISMLT